MALIEKLSAIGDAIREKTGKGELIPLDDMPAEVRSIKRGENYAIGICDGSLTDITDEHLGGIKTFRSCAFYGSSITSINVSTVETIELSAFRDTNKLTKAEFHNLTKFASSNIFRNSAIQEGIFPKLINTVTSDFENSNIKRVDFGALKTLANWSFYGATKLEALIIRTPSVCALETTGAFAGSTVTNGGTGFVYVPRDLVESYKTATNWTAVADQIRAIEDYPEICGGAE